MKLGVYDLCVNLAGQEIISHLTQEFSPCGVQAIVGPSGCGKTTLMRCLAGLQAPCSGQVAGFGDVRRSMVFQEHRLLPWYDALTNVALVVNGDRERALAALELVELTEAAGKLPDALSGGMQRRVALARAVAFDGDILLMDEPAAGLDESLSFRILERILTRWQGRAVFLVAHEKELVKRYADCVYEIRSSPVRALYQQS